MNSPTNELKFQCSYDIMLAERELRNRRSEKVIYTGIQPFDDMSGGVISNDMIVIGAGSGVGKTELVVAIAMYNMFLGLKIFIYALEAERFEIERRIKYKLIVSLISSNSPDQLRGINYLDWISGNLNYITDYYEKIVDEQYGSSFQNLFCFYRSSDFGIEEFEKLLLSAKDQADLVIIDHLHYFDWDDGNEARAIKTTVKKIRDLALLVSIPVILVSHLRRSSGKSPSIVPGPDEFHGSSEILKIATKAFTLAPVLDRSDEFGRWLTYIRMVKCRFDGSRTRYVAMCCYDPILNKYTPNYELGTLNSTENKFTKIDSFKTPSWAKHIAMEE